mgnify:CR=1 FL=1
MKHSTPVILKKKDDEIGPQKKSVVSLQTEDTAQATDAGQNKGPDTMGWLIIVIVIVFVCGVGGYAIYKGLQARKKNLNGGGTVLNTVAVGPNTVAANVPSIIDEEVSSILTGLSQL